MSIVPEDDCRKYYRSALLILQYIESRKPTGRRFGPDADALWSTFHGDLSFSDRIDLLIGDADTEWFGAFGARGVFALRAVAEDDSFGSEWSSLDSVEAAELWHEIIHAPPPTNTEEAIAAVAKTWGIPLTPMDVPPVDPTDRIAAAGPSAVAALVRAFEQGTDLDWRAQVVCAASAAVDRQLAAAAAAFLGASAVSPILSSHASTGGIARVNRTVISDDASPADAATAEHLAFEAAP